MSRVKKINLSGEVEIGITLKDLIKQAGDTGTFDTLIMEIASQGGSVEEGLNIMKWMDSLSGIGKEVITVVSANAYSIASLIMLVADKRYISEHAEVMVHNPMISFMEYANANELESTMKELRELEVMLRTLYVEFANVKESDIKFLMDNETFISPEEAVRQGFADEIINIKPKPYAMMAKKNEINMTKTRNILNQIISAVQGKETVNQLYYNTKGGELEIYQMNPTVYSVGDKTSVEAGSVRLMDGTILKIDAFEIKAIEKEIESVEEEKPAEEPMAVDVPVEEAPAEEPVAEFNQGAAPADEPVAKVAILAKAKQNVMELAPVAPVAPTKVEDVITAVEEEVVPVVPVEEVPVEPIAAEEPIVEPVVEPVEPIAVDEPIVSPEVEVEETPAEEAEEGSAHEKMIVEVAQLKVVVEELMAKVAALEAGAEESMKFENLATEAIDVLAKNTSSVFAPTKTETKAVIENKGNTIFQRFNQKNK
jgi:ATP-dependent protease ClpP protease subunit